MNPPGLVQPWTRPERSRKNSGLGLVLRLLPRFAPGGRVRLVVIGARTVGDAVALAEPAVEVDLLATGRAERPELGHHRLAADRAFGAHATPPTAVPHIAARLGPARRRRSSTRPRRDMLPTQSIAGSTITASRRVSITCSRF